MEHHKLNGNPTIFVMLGATGDLAEKKIIPALFNLYKKGKLPEKFKVIGFAKSKYTDEEFQKFAAGKLKGATKKQKNNFSSMFTYRQGLFEKKEDYKELIDAVTDIDDNWGVCSNKLFYLAVLPEFFEIIARNLSKTGLTAPCSPEEGWTRILVEKPFGKDAKTARRLDELLSTLFNENQIYRIDHYLAKEMLQNILAFRFSNNLLESSWNNRSVEKIDIRLWEKIGVENRGAFYDGVGALRDVGQNHLLQMLALVTMDHPQDFRSDSIRLKRAELMRTLTPPPPQDIKKFSYRAQHKGYREIEGVDNKSQTETYFKIRGFLSHPLWRNVPIYMESGKRLEKQLKEVVVTFKHPNPCMCPPEIEEHYRNQVKFTLEPEEGIKITFLTKEPGLDFEVSEGEFNFTMRKNNQGAQYVEEYEKLLLDCIEGDNTLFVSTDEVRAMWNFIDPFLEAWEQNKVPLKNYKPGTLEPVKAVDIAQNHIVKERIKKELGIVGLGKMGSNLAESLKEKGWFIVGYDKNIINLEWEGMHISNSIKEAIERLTKPRVLWTMVPHGVLDSVLFENGGLSELLEEGDTIIDGGNNFYKDSARRYKKLKQKGINFIDVGVSGGPEGARYGASLMIGGDRKTFEHFEQLFYDVAREGGYEFFEGAGAGHFVKAIHNGIEYGMMQSIAEGFTVLKKSKYNLDLNKIASVYSHGSVIESRLIEWLHGAFELYGENLNAASGSVGHGETANWTLQAAEDLDLRTKIIEEALKFREQSEKNPSYTGKILTALRNQFGGHPLK